MKNAMKKLMSLVLVAMILVSALPFAASADSEDFTFWVELKLDNEVIDAQTVTVAKGTAMSAALAKELAAPLYAQYFGEGYTYVGAYDCTGNVGEDGYIGVGVEFKTVVVDAGDEDDSDDSTNNAPTAYAMSIDVDGELKVLTDRVSVTYEEVLQMTGLKASDIDYIVYEGSAVSGTQLLDAGYVINLAGETRIFVFTEEKVTTPSETTPPETTAPSTNATSYNKNSGDVVLEICMDKNQTPNKTVSIKSGVALDGVVTLDEVKTVVKKYYGSVDTATGIVYDGLYIKQTYAGNIIEWVNDDKASTVEGLYEAANNSKLVTIRVYISNARATTSSGKADSSNPKTGDGIFMAVATMTASASALATGFFFNKKRAL